MRRKTCFLTFNQKSISNLRAHKLDKKLVLSLNKSLLPPLTTTIIEL